MKASDYGRLLYDAIVRLESNGKLPIGATDLVLAEVGTHEPEDEYASLRAQISARDEQIAGLKRLIASWKEE